jgi:drug/metabolite transporter superfamily protein YnfA
VRVFTVREIVVFALEAAVAVAVLLFIMKWGRINNRFAVAALGTALGVVAWNLTLNRTDAWGFTRSVNRLVNISWQDAGTGVVVFACTALLFGWVTEPQEPSQRTIRAATIAGATAMVMDVFLLG